MPRWMETTKMQIANLRAAGFYDHWTTRQLENILFLFPPDFTPSAGWLEKRVEIYRQNADILRVKMPSIKFYLYPSMEEGKKLGIVPAISFIKDKEIHGHINQSPGHELTHILLGEINTSDNFPGNGLWSEGICSFLDGTKTDFKKFVLSKNYSTEIMTIPWENWRQNIPGELYPIAGSIVSYCQEKFDWKNVMKFIKQLKNHASNENEASNYALAIDYQTIQKGWRDWISTK